MGWTVEIQHSAGTYTFDDNYNWEPRFAKQLTAKGIVEYVDFYLDVKGQVVAATPGDVADETKVIADLVAIRLTPVTVTIKLDGVTKWTFTPGTSVAGPSVVEFNPEPENGNGGSRWAFSLTIFARLPGNNFAGLHELRTQLTVVKNISGVVVTKVWQATGKASTLATARSGVLQFKPSGKVSEEIIQSQDPEPQASATWVWRRTLLVHIENIQIVGGGKSYEVDPQAGVGVRPLLHLARRGAQIIRLDGVIQGPEKDKLVAPPAHWRESATLKRQEAFETQSKPTHSSPQDIELGLKSHAYSEVYVNTGDTLPEPNHGAHGVTLNSEKEPADGAILR